MSVDTAAERTTFKSAVYQIRSKIRNGSLTGVHIYSFNIPEDQLQYAHDMLDRQQERRSMRVTYSLDHNFIVRHIPGRVHAETIEHWNHAFTHALNGLILTPPDPEPLGCVPIGSTTFVFGERKKQPDGGVRPAASNYPSVVLEVGSSESLTQLVIDAKLWLECSADVNLVVLISIDPPLAPNTTPRITVQRWTRVAPVDPPRPGTAAQRHAQMVQNDDWTLNATPLRILFSEIFGIGAPIPPAYGGHLHVDLDTQWLRQRIIDSQISPSLKLVSNC